MGKNLVQFLKSRNKNVYEIDIKKKLKSEKIIFNAILQEKNGKKNNKTNYKN